MSVHFQKEKGHAFWDLATRAHNDNPIEGFGPEVIGTPYGIMDGGHIFFRGYEFGEEPYLADLRRMQERKTAGADLQSDFYYSPEGELIVAVSVTSHLDFVLGAENDARINVGLLERKREPYFSISATTQQAGGLCGDLEPGGNLRCGISLGKLNPGVFAQGAEIFVALTYRPDPAKESHDALQSGRALGDPDMKPTIIHLPYVARAHSR
jgi:hypothetical protein